MMNLRNARRRALAAGAVALPLLFTACDPKKELLEPQQPGVISPTDIQNATGAEALYVGALSRMKRALNGFSDAAWNWAGLFTDEFKSADTFSQRNDADQRNLQDNDALVTSIWRALGQGRGYARTALEALQKFEPEATTKIGEMYLTLGTVELTMGQEFCNGIPLGETKNGQPIYTEPLTTAAVFAVAITHFDSALTVLGSATDAASKSVRNATLVQKARAQVDLGKFAEAATTVSGVPTPFEYHLTYSNTTNDNQWWVLGPSIERYSLGDSIDTSGPVLNAVPFASSNDPRVPVHDYKKAGEDNQTPFVWTTRLDGRDDPLPLASGIDARLIEAEAKLQTGDFAGMMTILNSLRTSGQTIGAFDVPPMPALAATPATKDAAANLLFREKAYWQFGRGVRMDDLRRLVRQYGRPQDQVFPSGKFVKTGNYGTEVAFPVPDDEKTNPKFTGCIDRKA
jgi:starch-binding outer membrane protein, SusD/RagB family